MTEWISPRIASLLFAGGAAMDPRGVGGRLAQVGLPMAQGLTAAAAAEKLRRQQAEEQARLLGDSFAPQAPAGPAVRPMTRLGAPSQEAADMADTLAGPSAPGAHYPTPVATPAPAPAAAQTPAQAGNSPLDRRMAGLLGLALTSRGGRLDPADVVGLSAEQVGAIAGEDDRRRERAARNALIAASLYDSIGGSQAARQAAVKLFESQMDERRQAAVEGLKHKNQMALQETRGQAAKGRTEMVVEGRKEAARIGAEGRRNIDGQISTLERRRIDILKRLADSFVDQKGQEAQALRQEVATIEEQIRRLRAQAGQPADQGDDSRFIEARDSWEPRQ